MLSRCSFSEVLGDIKYITGSAAGIYHPQVEIVAIKPNIDVHRGGPRVPITVNVNQLPMTNSINIIIPPPSNLALPGKLQSIAFTLFLPDGNNR